MERVSSFLRIAEVLPRRIGKFGLALAEDKTKLLRFGRRHWKSGQRHYFDFLGFRHFLGTDRRGRMTVVRLPSPKSVRKFLMGLKEWLRRNVHTSPRYQQQVLGQKLRGFYQYFALWYATKRLWAVRYHVYWYWTRTLRRRSQTHLPKWDGLRRKPWFELPRPKLLHKDI